MDTLRDSLQQALGRDYRVTRELGGGGMSRVFEAVEVELGRPVVIKVLPPEMAADLSVERFRREIQVAATLQHPHIVPLHATGQVGNLIYYTMPLVEGESLRALIRREGPLPVASAIGILRDVVGALAHAHRRGVVHRDIKPDNVLVSAEHALVTDFGVAKALDHPTGGATTLTTAGIAVGTPAYMAPEQAAGESDVDHRADLYAVGVLGYELLAGQPPFSGRSMQQLLAAQLTAAPTPLGRHRADLPPGLEAVVMRCLERDPARRFQSADDLARALTGVGTSGARPSQAVAARLRHLKVSHILLGVVLLGALGLLTQFLRRGAPPPSATTVAVLPFAVRGSGDVAYLGDGIVNLIATSLDGAGDLRSVDPRALLGAVRREGGGPPDPERAAAIAARFGAGLYVLGDIVQAGDRLRIDAALYGDGNAGPTRTAVTVEGAATDVFRLVDDLSARLLAARGNVPGGRVTRIAAVTTGSLPALKAYLEGETEFRAGRFSPAVEAFEAAVAADTAFALAYYRLSIATEWALRPDDAAAAAELAVRHAARLSDHDRALLDALLAARRGDFLEAERRYRAIVTLYPDDVEAWLQLGEVLFHAGRLFGRPLTDSRDPFDRVVALEPEHATALIHLVRIAAVEGDAALTDSLADWMLRLNPGGDRAFEVEALRLDLRGAGADWGDFEAALHTAQPATALQGVYSIYEYGNDLAVAERLLEGLLADPTSPELRTAARVWLGHARALQGRWREALETMAASGAARRAEPLVHRAFLATLPFFPISSDTLRAIGRALTAWNAAGEPPSALPSAYFNVHTGFYPAIRLYLLGLVADRLGDSAATRRSAEELARWRGPARSADVVRRWELGLRARMLVAQGRPAEALALLEPSIRAGDYERKLFSPFLGHTAERFLAGTLLAELGRLDEARVWLGAMRWFGMFDRTLEAPAAWRIAQIFERQGRADSAVAYYTRVMDLWRDADEELQPVVADARARIAALRSDR